MNIYKNTIDLNQNDFPIVNVGSGDNFTIGIKPIVNGNYKPCTMIRIDDGVAELSSSEQVGEYSLIYINGLQEGAREYKVKYDFTDGTSAFTKMRIVARNTGVTSFDRTLGIASSTMIGGVKVGAGLSISEDGTLSASGGEVPTKVSQLENDLGFVKSSDLSTFNLSGEYEDSTTFSFNVVYAK